MYSEYRFGGYSFGNTCSSHGLSAVVAIAYHDLLQTIVLPEVA